MILRDTRERWPGPAAPAIPEAGTPTLRPGPAP